jgi:hypothetical protein
VYDSEFRVFKFVVADQGGQSSRNGKSKEKKEGNVKTEKKRVEQGRDYSVKEKSPPKQIPSKQTPSKQPLTKPTPAKQAKQTESIIENQTLAVHTDIEIMADIPSPIKASTPRKKSTSQKQASVSKTKTPRNIEDEPVLKVPDSYLQDAANSALFSPTFSPVASLIDIPSSAIGTPASTGISPRDAIAAPEQQVSPTAEPADPIWDMQPARKLDFGELEDTFYTSTTQPKMDLSKPVTRTSRRTRSISGKSTELIQQDVADLKVICLIQLQKQELEKSVPSTSNHFTVSKESSKLVFDTNCYIRDLRSIVKCVDAGWTVVLPAVGLIS